MKSRTPRVPLAPPVLLALLTALGPAQAAPPRSFTPGVVAGGRLDYQDGVPILQLSGTPEEMGRQHAALLAEPAQRALKYPKDFLDEFGVGFVWPVLVSGGQILMTHAPASHREETTALIRASQLDAGEVAVANTLLELRRMACSVLIVEPAKSAAGGPLFGRNFDFDTLGELDKYSLVMVYRPTGRHAFAAVGFPATLGVFSGMNDAGLALATLDVEAAGDGSPKFDLAGTPLAFVFRRILEECTTVAEAEKLLAREHATTWANLAVCDRDHGAIFEITPKHIARRDAAEGVLPCTNHFRSPGLVVDTECDRYPELASAAAEQHLDLAAVQRRLHAASQPRRTLQTMIFEPRRLVLHLAIGQPDTSDDPLVAIDLRPLFAASPAPTAPIASDSAGGQ